MQQAVPDHSGEGVEWYRGDVGVRRESPLAVVWVVLAALCDNPLLQPPVSARQCVAVEWARWQVPMIPPMSVTKHRSSMLERLHRSAECLMQLSRIHLQP